MLCKCCVPRALRTRDARGERRKQLVVIPEKKKKGDKKKIDTLFTMDSVFGNSAALVPAVSTVSTDPVRSANAAVAGANDRAGVSRVGV